MRALHASPLAALLALTALCVAPPARAELWTSSLGDLLRSALRVEVVEVTAVGPSGSALRVVESLRGRPVGSLETLQLAHVSQVTVGERVLLVCDRAQCPRAIGHLRHGVYVLEAHEPGDGAWVLPPLVEPASLPALTRGTSPGPLCVRASVDLGATPVDLTLRLSPAQGSGVARTGLVPFELQATVRTGDARSDALLLSLSRGDARQHLAGALSGRDADGCLRVASTPTAPLARTPAELRENLSSAPVARPIARGSATLTGTRPLPAGTWPITLEAGPNGELWLTGVPGIGRTPTFYRSDARSLEVGYPRSGASNDAALRLRLALPPQGTRDAVSWVMTSVARGPLTLELFPGDAENAPSVGRAQVVRVAP